MKKYVGLLALWMGVIAGLVAVAHAAQTCQRTDFLCFESGPSGNLSTPARLDSSGNLTLLGTSSVTGASSFTGATTFAGNAIYTPGSQVTVSTQVPVAPTSAFMLILSTGGPVTFSATGSYPAIATATATNGQFVTLASTSTGNAVYISTGTGSAVTGDNSSIVISSSMSAVQFMYSSALSTWLEVGRQ